jgi:hypothetical protein
MNIIYKNINFEELSEVDKLAYRFLRCKFFKKYKNYQETLKLETDNEKVMLTQILLCEQNKREFIQSIKKIKQIEKNFVNIEVTLFKYNNFYKLLYRTKVR